MSGSQIMVVLIILIISVGRIYRIRHNTAHGIIEDRRGRFQMIATPQDDTSRAEMQRELDALRERVKVLERIATDERQSRSIAAEIEALRDK